MYQLAFYVAWTKDAAWGIHRSSESGLEFYWRDIRLQIGRLCFTVVLSTPLPEGR